VRPLRECSIAKEKWDAFGVPLSRVLLADPPCQRLSHLICMRHLRGKGLFLPLGASVVARVTSVLGPLVSRHYLLCETTPAYQTRIRRCSHRLPYPIEVLPWRTDIPSSARRCDCSRFRADGQKLRPKATVLSGFRARSCLLFNRPTVASGIHRASVADDLSATSTVHGSYQAPRARSRRRAWPLALRLRRWSR
jgi:hypothetical protein